MATVNSKKTCPSAIYLDNNGTTLISTAAKDVYIKWLSCYNASSDSKLSKPANIMLDKSINSILSHCGVSTATHTVLFTSGGSESNCLFIRACVKAYKKKLQERESDLLPHIIVSSLEHHSIMECVKDLFESGDVDVTYVQPTIYGNILPIDVEKEIKANTCCVSIMYANNEIPVISNVREIGELCHKHRVPLHSDCVQIFGKFKINMSESNIDAISASAHKFYGPKGMGILIVSNEVIDGYGLTGEINGSQQYGLRGGTENIAGIASMLTALKSAFTDRKKKNEKLFELRSQLLEKLSKSYVFAEFNTYLDDNQHEPLELVSLGPPADKKGFILPNTILLSVVKNKGKPFCNVELKKFLDANGIVVSIGSACLTKNHSASHVLTAIGAPQVIKRGVIRISFGDTNTLGELTKFIAKFKEGVKRQTSDLNGEL